MRKTIVPALAALCAGAPLSLSAIEVEDLTIGGYVDAYFTYTDVDSADDPDLDFAGDVELQFSYAIGEDVVATAHLDFPGNGGAALETGIVTWAISDQVSLMMGQYINYLGWEAADAPARYLIGRSFLLPGNFYGAATNTGLGAFFEPADNLHLKVFLQDHVYGESAGRASDALAFVGDVVYDIEGYGSVNLELVYDQENAVAFGGPAEEDVLSINLNQTVTAVDKMVIGGEVFFLDYEAATALGVMGLANYAFAENMSITGRVAYINPSDEADDDEGFEPAIALLTNPTGDANFAVNYELLFQSWGDNASGEDTTMFSVEFLAVIP